MGKADAPPPIDAAGAAEKTAAGDLAAARAASAANRVNQITPYGSLTWKQDRQPTFDEAGYNQALANYNKDMEAFSKAPSTIGEQVQRKWVPGGQAGGYWETKTVDPLKLPARPNTPTREQFTSYALPEDGGWVQTQTLTPQSQATLDKQLALSDQYADVAGIGFQKARGLLESPQLDVSQLPKRAIDVGQTAQDAIMSRLGPQFAQQEEALRTRLANQGITLGSSAYGQEQQQFQQGRNDAMMQAALQGINLDQSNRASALQEQAYMQDRPLNLINALRTGAQVQSPQFQQFAQQPTTKGPDLLGAQAQQYGNLLDITNTNNANRAATTSAIAGIASAFLF
jgi:hypothetical protein